MMICMLRSTTSRQIVVLAPTIIRFVSTSASAATMFQPSTVKYSAVKPGSESELTTPGSGSTEDIANTEGAYDGSKTNPHSSTNQIQLETDANFSNSSAKSQPSQLATKHQHESNSNPSKQQQTNPDTHNFGATKPRK